MDLNAIVGCDKMADAVLLLSPVIIPSAIPSF
jgi:hypothetical protein